MKPINQFTLFMLGVYILMLLGVKEIVDIIYWSFNHG